MKNFLFIFVALFLISCGKDGKNGTSIREDATTFGVEAAVPTGVDFESIQPGLVCSNGGTSIFTFRDLNSDGLMQADESILRIKSLCNGIHGTNATISIDSFALSTLCPNGGIKFTTGTSSPVEVCNGKDGINGEQGLPGIQGIPGLAGSDGVNGSDGDSILPIKFCSEDKSKLPEYGLLIGKELFAVHWAKSKAFLTKLIAANYKSTDGNNCLFSIHKQ
ncbi:MAG TPA: hypothetical protein VNJ08_06300 [Bacteriovoracaceae bacterium]|nr:hypothetical protein [Bacteriovoracaceae bacterium]